MNGEDTDTIARRSFCKTAVQTVVFWSLALAVVPCAIVHAEAELELTRWWFASPIAELIGIAIFVPAGTLGLWSGWTMAVRGLGTPLPLDPAQRLVIDGPYRWVRNPMAIGGLLQGAGVGVFLGSPGVLLYVLAGGLLWNFSVRRWEERDLLARFGTPYERYRRVVRCWVPRRRPLRKRRRSSL